MENMFLEMQNLYGQITGKPLPKNFRQQLRKYENPMPAKVSRDFQPPAQMPQQPVPRTAQSVIQGNMDPSTRSYNDNRAERQLQEAISRRNTLLQNDPTVNRVTADAQEMLRPGGLVDKENARIRKVRNDNEMKLRGTGARVLQELQNANRGLAAETANRPNAMSPTRSSAFTGENFPDGFRFGQDYERPQAARTGQVGPTPRAQGQGMVPGSGRQFPGYNNFEGQGGSGMPKVGSDGRGQDSSGGAGRLSPSDQPPTNRVLRPGGRLGAIQDTAEAINSLAQGDAAGATRSGLEALMPFLPGLMANPGFAAAGGLIMADIMKEGRNTIPKMSPNQQKMADDMSKEAQLAELLQRRPMTRNPESKAQNRPNQGGNPNNGGAIAPAPPVAPVIVQDRATGRPVVTPGDRALATADGVIRMDDSQSEYRQALQRAGALKSGVITNRETFIAPQGEMDQSFPNMEQYEEFNPRLAARARTKARARVERLNRPVMRTGPRREIQMGDNGLPRNMLPVPSMNQPMQSPVPQYTSSLGSNTGPLQIEQERVQAQMANGMGSQGAVQLGGAVEPIRNTRFYGAY